MSLRRLTLGLWLAALLAAVPLLTAGTAGAAIAPPWCGTPEPDAAANLPDGSSPAHPNGSFPHIPYYAIGCTLDAIAAQSGGRMKVERHGVSATGRQMYRVTINELDTKSQRRAYSNWQDIRRYARSDPRRAQSLLRRADDDVKVPLYVQGGIHGNESESVDGAMQVIERLATTPYGTDPEVDQILDQAILIFNPVQNPDGRVAGTRANGNGFDLNRDFLTQSQPETQASVETMQEWLAPEMLDLHGYVTPTLIEATTKPHNPGIEYDFWLKWNQSRIDANEAAMNAEGFAVTRPINDWCWDGDLPVNGICTGDNSSRPNDWGPRWAESWDDWGPFYTPMYSQLVGLNGSTVEMCNPPNPPPLGTPTPCGPGTTTYAKVGRLGAQRHQYITVWSSLLYDTDHRSALMHDQLEVYRRGVNDAPRPTTADLAPQTADPTDPDIPPGFDNEENNWMVDYPKAYVIPLGDDQRSDVEAVRLVRWLLANGIEVHRMRNDDDDDDDDDDDRGGSGSSHGNGYVVWMDQAHRGLAYTALDTGFDISADISILYAPPAAWSHGALWGADVDRIDDGEPFSPRTSPIRSVSQGRGELEGRRASAYAIALDSATAVRTVNGLLADGVSASATTVPFSAGDHEFPAGSILFPASAKRALEDAAEDSGLDFQGLRGALPASETIDGAPSIAVLNTNALTDQSTWVLRDLGFTATPINVTALNGPSDPLAGHDLIFNTAINYPGNTPGNATARARLTGFFAAGGGYLGAGTNGVNFLSNGGQVGALTVASNSGGGAGYSGIIRWENSAPGTSVVTGAYPETDTAIVDPPTWFTSIPSTMTKDGALPGLAGFFLSGLWPGSGSAAGTTMIAHGTNTAGSARLTSFAMNPLYRADPEREWPMLASAAYWVDQ